MSVAGKNLQYFFEFFIRCIFINGNTYFIISEIIIEIEFLASANFLITEASVLPANCQKILRAVVRNPSLSSPC